MRSTRPGSERASSTWLSLLGAHSRRTGSQTTASLGDIDRRAQPTRQRCACYPMLDDRATRTDSRSSSQRPRWARPALGAEVRADHNLTEGLPRRVGPRGTTAKKGPRSSGGQRTPRHRRPHRDLSAQPLAKRLRGCWFGLEAPMLWTEKPERFHLALYRCDSSGKS